MLRVDDDSDKDEDDNDDDDGVKMDVTEALDVNAVNVE